MTLLEMSEGQVVVVLEIKQVEQEPAVRDLLVVMVLPQDMVLAVVVVQVKLEPMVLDRREVTVEMVYLIQ